MREFSPEFESHLSNDVTTLCLAWKMELSDGRIFGFSQHDQDLLIDGITYHARSSLLETEVENRLGFAADNAGFQAVLDAIDMSEEEIAAGVLSGAKLFRIYVNWADPTQYVTLDVGEIGQVTTQGDYFDVEWMGLSRRLDQSVGRVYAKKCDAEFGDARCGLDVSAYSEGTFCPKSFLACKDQFNNADNFRGFPFLIGDDDLYAGPIDGQRKDGSSRYS